MPLFLSKNRSITMITPEDTNSYNAWYWWKNLIK